MTPKQTAKHKSSLRIIGGKWKSRRIFFPENAGVRPTSDRVRETLFNWLMPYVSDAVCLDLFAGSGALGFEALSRGAKQVVMADQSAAVIKQLKQTAQELNPALKTNNIYYAQAQMFNNINHININIIKFLKSELFDIVFLDPPFYQELIAPSCEWLIKANFIDNNTVIYIETENQTPLTLPCDFKILKQGKTAQTAYYLVQLTCSA